MPLRIDEDNLDGYQSLRNTSNGLSWKAVTRRCGSSLSIDLHCNMEERYWSCLATAVYRLVSPSKDLTKTKYLLHFDPENTKRGYEQFAPWDDLKPYLTTAKQYNLLIEIQAIGIGKREGVWMKELSSDDQSVKMEITFNHISSIFGALSPAIRLCDSEFRLCVLKQDKSINRPTDEPFVWFHLTSQVPEDTRIKWGYQVDLLKKNASIGPLSVQQDSIISKAYDSVGAKLISLSHLFDCQNLYVSDDSITFELEIKVTTIKRRVATLGTPNVTIKTEPEPSNVDEPTSSMPARSSSPQPSTSGLSSSESTNQPDPDSQSHDSTLANFTYNDDDDLSEEEKVLCGFQSQTQTEPGGSLKRKASSNPLACWYCANNLLDTEICTTKCGHLYCEECMEWYILEHGTCLRCNKTIPKRDGWFKIQRTNADPSNASSELGIRCKLCNDDLLEVQSMVALKCGHTYCKQCFEINLQYRNSCVLCPTRFRAQPTEIFAS